MQGREKARGVGTIVASATFGAFLTICLAASQAQQYSGQQVFSASDADVGKTQTALDDMFLGLNRGSGISAFDSSKYYEGRFSNGQNYAELLPAKLGYEYDPDTNYAWGGAATGPYAATLPGVNDNNLADLEALLADPTAEGLTDLLTTILGELPEYSDPGTIPFAVVFQLVPGQHSMSTQVEEYLAENPTTPGDQLYIIGPAYNDYFAYHQRDPAVPADNQEQMMADLYDAGAREFAVFAYGGETEFGSNYSEEIVERSNRFQREHPGSKVYVVDFDRGIAEVKSNPEAYGFSDNFNSCWSDGLYLDACPDDRLYYDDVHPTRTGHELVADFFYATIVSGYQGPRQMARLPEMSRLATMGPVGEVATRIDDRRNDPLPAVLPGAASGSTGGTETLQLWVRTGFGFGSRDGNDVAQDYSYTSQHLVAGADISPVPDFLFGLAAGFSALQGDYDGVGGTVDLYSYALSAYGAWAAGPVTVSGQVGYAFDTYRDIERATGMPQQPIATGSPDGNSFFARLGLAADMAMDGITIVPRMALTYIRTHVDGFQEDGAVLFNFNVTAQDTTSLRGEIGISARRLFQSELLGPIEAEAGLAFEHEFEDGAREVMGVFPNGSEQFVQSSFEKADAAIIDLGMRFAADTIVTGSTLRLSYGGRIGSDGDDHLLSASLLVPLN